MPANQSPLDDLPLPREIHSHMGRLYQELALLRRLLRLSQTVQTRASRDEKCEPAREIPHADKS
jgi:hypothetical protein